MVRLRRTAGVPEPPTKTGADAGAGTEARTLAAALSRTDAAVGTEDSTLGQPAPEGEGLLVGVVTVQNETTAGRSVMQQAGPGMVGGHHLHAFGANCEAPSDINFFFNQMGSSLPKVMYVAVAPNSLGTTGCGNPDLSRISTTSGMNTFIGQVRNYLNANSSIKWLNFWNEMKGYSWGDNESSRQLFYSHYIQFATGIKATHPNILIGGPYSTGGLNDTILLAIHNGFIDNVVIPHPELVDFIVWDHSSGVSLIGGIPRHKWYTNIYQNRGITLPHQNAEWYPGGWNTSSPPSRGQIIRDIMSFAENPLMGQTIIWSGGSDPAMKAPLWNSSGTPTTLFNEIKKAANFTRHGGVVKLDSNNWENAIGQNLNVNGDTITVT